MKQVTHALANWLGYDTPEELQKVDFPSTVFESGSELQWIVDRCLASRSTESVETTWRKRDGSSVIVRLQAVATTPESIDLAAQDITTLRVVEEKLRNSQRMEAVARYALPNPKPAVYVFTVKPLKDTPIQRGIVEPEFGQPGKGVEVLFCDGTAPKTVTGSCTIPGR